MSTAPELITVPPAPPPETVTSLTDQLDREWQSIVDAPPDSTKGRAYRDLHEDLETPAEVCREIEWAMSEENDLWEEDQVERKYGYTVSVVVRPRSAFARLWNIWQRLQQLQKRELENAKRGNE